MSERSAVQEPMLRYADEIGWQAISPSEAMHMRGGNAIERYLTDVLKAQLLKLNKGVVDDSNCADVMRLLGLLSATLEGNQEALFWMRGEKPTFVASENRNRNVTLIDFENPDNNLFHVTDEWTQQGVVESNRADVVFLINGIPVAIVEAKNAGKPDGLALGVEQIRRYHSETPEMFITAQIFGVTQLLDFFYGVTWNTSRKNLFNWKTDEPTNYEQKVKAFFDRNRILKVLQQSIIFQNRDDQLTKIVLRQHQTRAVEKVIERVHDPNKLRGLVWHTQGSGKTLTMITIAARLLRGEQQAEKPTVLMVVDRNELESQLFRNITGYGITTLEVAQSKAKQRAIEHFEDKDDREAFFKFFKGLQNLYDILSPDAFLREFIADYQALTILYGLIRNAYANRTYVDKELTAKTRELLKDRTESDLFELPDAVYELGADTLEKIDQSDASDTVKVLNLQKALYQTVTTEGKSKPFLLSIGDRAEAITETYGNRQMATQDVLAEFRRLAEECALAARESERLSMDENTFAVYTVLRNVIEDVNPEQARAVDQVFAQFSDYQWNEQEEKELRAMLYKTLRPTVGTKELIETTNKLLRLERV